MKMDISTIILIIFILAVIGFIDGIIERKAPPYIFRDNNIFCIYNKRINQTNSNYLCF